MAFQIRKISDVGTSNPIVSRLGVQTGQLLDFTNISTARKDKINSLYIGVLTKRLLKCESALNSIEKEMAEDTIRVQINIQNDSRLKEIPYVIGLESHVEDFLYSAKNYLRDLLILFKEAYNCPYVEAKVFGDLPEKGEIEIAKWAARHFSEDDVLVALLRSESEWTTELIRKRNALEHPGEKSGALILHNIRLHRSGLGLVPPTWQRSAMPETDVISDMKAFVYNLLTLAEDLLADLVMRSLPMKGALSIYEIPEENRNPAMPIRLQLNLSPELATKLAQADKKKSKP